VSPGTLAFVGVPHVEGGLPPFTVSEVRGGTGGKGWGCDFSNAQRSADFTPKKNQKTKTHALRKKQMEKRDSTEGSRKTKRKHRLGRKLKKQKKQIDCTMLILKEKNGKNAEKQKTRKHADLSPELSLLLRLDLFLIWKKIKI
jgi:hypothetical protein